MRYQMAPPSDGPHCRGQDDDQHYHPRLMEYIGQGTSNRSPKSTLLPNPPLPRTHTHTLKTLPLKLRLHGQVARFQRLLDLTHRPRAQGVRQMETTIYYHRVYIGIMEKKMETIILLMEEISHHLETVNYCNS